MRNMSFMLTPEQILDGSKTVTRRLGWEFLKAGDLIQAVRKCQGLKKGEKIQKLRALRVVSVSREPLDAICFYRNDIAREGFPEMFIREFIIMFCRTHKGCTPDTVVTRIEFEYVEA